jgi:hypothetical protein
MAGPENTPDSSAFGRLLHSEARFLSRVTAVLRFDPAVYEEIEKDPYAIAQAFAAVIATALLAGLGQGSLAAIFLGIALAILIWAGVTGLVWGVGVLVAGPASHFPNLLRCLGFAYIWVGLLIGSGLPYLGGLFSWGAVLLYLASLVLATRQVLQTTTGRAILISAIALGFPLLILLLIAG